MILSVLALVVKAMDLWMNIITLLMTLYVT